MTEDAACFNTLFPTSELSPSFFAGDEEGPEVKQQLGSPSVCTGEACIVVKCCTVSMTLGLTLASELLALIS